jgi:hypothetical protein
MTLVELGLFALVGLSFTSAVALCWRQFRKIKIPG